MYNTKQFNLLPIENLELYAKAHEHVDFYQQSDENESYKGQECPKDNENLNVLVCWYKCLRFMFIVSWGGYIVIHRQTCMGRYQLVQV